ncbi:hypothetical protein Lal_00015169 [Lupinus albus]|nr:hypothetical protein Lal_00015169 [Lupinus albus]
MSKGGEKGGHIKEDCPTLKKKDNYSKKFNNNKVNNYNDISSSSDSDNEENAQIALMASHQSEDELDEVSNSFELHSYDELQEAFNELHDEFLKLSKICSKQKKTIVELESKVNSQNKLTSCNKCIEKESKIHELTNEINTLNRSTKNLDKILLNQRPSNNKRGIDCPTLKKKDSYSKNFNNNKVNNYNDISSSSDSDNEENAQIALMASHQSEDELDEVSNSFELHSYDELQEALKNCMMNF